MNAIIHRLFCKNVKVNLSSEVSQPNCVHSVGETRSMLREYYDSCGGSYISLNVEFAIETHFLVMPYRKLTLKKTFLSS